MANRVDGGVLRRRAILRVPTPRPLLRARAVLAIGQPRGTGEPAVQPLAQLVGVVVPLGAAPAGDDHAGRGDAGESGEADRASRARASVP